MSLRQRRNERLMSIRRLAEASGVNKQTIINIEAGRHVPHQDTMRRLAVALASEPQEIDEFAAAILWRSFRPALPSPSEE